MWCVRVDHAISLRWQVKRMVVASTEKDLRMAAIAGKSASDGTITWPIAQADSAHVARMWTALFRSHETAEGAGILIGSQARLGTEIQAWIDLVIQSTDHFGFVAGSRGVHRGFIAVSIHTHPWLNPAEGGTIGAIWVEPTQRRRGVGRLLVESALAELAVRNVDTADVHAMVFTPGSRPFWQSLGFVSFAIQMRRPTAARRESETSHKEG
jgi:GNAT superfamily N-acetyltransferase